MSHGRLEVAGGDDHLAQAHGRRSAGCAGPVNGSPSVVHPVGEPVAGRAFAIAAVETTIGELQVVVVARTRLVAPPLRGDAPRAGDGDHASAETRAAHEAGSPALREHLE